jgi:ParB-like nuclease domain
MRIPRRVRRRRFESVNLSERVALSTYPLRIPGGASAFYHRRTDGGRGPAPYPGNPRTHSRKQVRQIAESIRRFGFTNPVLIGDGGEIIAGHGRVEAAKLIGLESVPTVHLAHVDEAQRRAYVLADNKLALNAGWDRDLLAIELQGLIDLEFDVELTGFSAAEIVLDEAREGSPDGAAEPDDQIPFVFEDSASAVTRPGDVWCLGRHRLICGDARGRQRFRACGAARLLEGRRRRPLSTSP